MPRNVSTIHDDSDLGRAQALFREVSRRKTHVEAAYDAAALAAVAAGRELRRYRERFTQRLAELNAIEQALGLPQTKALPPRGPRSIGPQAFDDE